jgi:hypothetical protein
VYDHPLWGNENCENVLCDNLMARAEVQKTNKQFVKIESSIHTRTHNFPIFQFDSFLAVDLRLMSFDVCDDVWRKFPLLEAKTKLGGEKIGRKVLTSVRNATNKKGREKFQP